MGAGREGGRIARDESERRGRMDAVTMATVAGLQGSATADGLGNVPRLGMDFSRFATKWG